MVWCSRQTIGYWVGGCVEGEGPEGLDLITFRVFIIVYDHFPFNPCFFWATSMQSIQLDACQNWWIRNFLIFNLFSRFDQLFLGGFFIKLTGSLRRFLQQKSNLRTNNKSSYQKIIIKGIYVDCKIAHFENSLICQKISMIDSEEPPPQKIFLQLSDEEWGDRNMSMSIIWVIWKG